MWEAIILLGAPGSGKGTTAVDLTEAVSEFTHVSTGDMLRAALKAGTQVGLEAKRYMEAGELVPDEVIMKIVQERLMGGPADAHYLFDGFPRTSDQARLLDELLRTDGRGQVTHVFLLEVPRDILVDRIAGRLLCRKCGAVYHIRNLPPKKEGLCDQCGGELYQRADDNRETVINRLEVFKKQTSDLIAHYEQQGVLKRITALQREKTLAYILEQTGRSAQAS